MYLCALYVPLMYAEPAGISTRRWWRWLGTSARSVLKNTAVVCNLM